MIKQAAILKDGIIYEGKRHSDIFQNTLPFGCLKGEDAIQGFVTDDGKFLNRKQAAQHAIRCRQIISLKWPPNLYSEDLY
jgi:hypothetical protein